MIRNLIRTYGIPIVVALVAVLFRWSFDPLLGDNMLLTAAQGAVIFAVWWGGYRSALFVMVFAYIVSDLLFIGPPGSLFLDDPIFYFRLGSYCILCLTIIFFGETMRRAQTKLRQEREILRITLASVGDAVITTDINGYITYMNAVAEALTGWTHTAAVGQMVETVFHIVSEKTGDQLENTATKSLRERVTVGLTTYPLLIHKDGTSRPIEDSASPLFDPEGKLSGSVLIFRDITPRRYREEIQERLAAIVNSSDDAIISKSLDGKINSWNNGAERIFGYSASEVIGKSIEIIIPPDRREEERLILARLKQGQHIDHFETVRITKNGNLINISLTVSPISDSIGRIIGASKVARDITDRITTAENLRDTARRKDEFLAILAHELRNPLAPVRNSIDILKQETGNPAIMEQALNTMDRQITHMERLIEDLLDISRITRNQLELRKQVVDIAASVQHVLEACRPHAERYGHKVIVSLPNKPIIIYADSVRLAQIMGNLLNNACKYTPPGGRITLDVEQQGNQVVISVKDNGIGISQQMLPKVFNMFSQNDRSAERSKGGLGIGLMLVKQLVEMHGGNVKAISNGLKTGSEFIVRLPIHSEAQLDEPVSVRHTDSQPKVIRRILVVDDQQDNANSLAKLLTLFGHDTKVAYDGRQAIATTEQFRPEVVLLDIGMPVMNGFDVCRFIREQSWGGDIVVVALTGWGQETDRRKTRDAGFNDHIVKPVSLIALNQLLSSLPVPPERSRNAPS